MRKRRKRRHRTHLITLPKNMWRVRCEICGTEALVSQDDLLSGAVQSCGCQGEQHLHRSYISNDKGERHLVVSTQPLCPECLEEN
jgi:hypothetical protein